MSDIRSGAPGRLQAATAFLAGAAFFTAGLAATFFAAAGAAVLLAGLANGLAGALGATLTAVFTATLTAGLLAGFFAASGFLSAPVGRPVLSVGTADSAAL
ncbi:hypothetical protein F9Z44_11605 [Hydrogenophaga sp. PBL-H3]|nr:hypothetical protein F9Z45_11605 [Hydrogenophaga sp. PBL-H3]QHE82821.1 hypothetical protein F9Z44_11605 [Hydrogenophaga sp. PBL-H3]